MAPPQNWSALTLLLPFFTTLISIILITAIVVRVISSSIRRTRPVQPAATAPPPPGPPKLPVIGNIHQLIRHPLVHRRLRDLAQRHGPHVMGLRLGEVLHVVISSAEAAREVMKTHDLVFATRPHILMAEIVMYGVRDVALAPYGDHWRQLRKICVMELLSARRVQSFRPVREAEVSRLVAGVSSAAAASAGVNVNLAVASATSGLTFKTAFGMAKELTEETFSGLVGDVSDALSGFRISEVFPSLTFLPALTGFRAQLTRLHHAADALLEEILCEHKDRRRRQGGGGGAVDGRQPEDLVDILLDLQEEGDQESLTDEAIKAVVLDMFVGGTETTTTAVEWTMSEMMKNPSIMKKAQEEVRRLSRGKAIVEEESLDELKYLEAVIQESLRLHPPLPLLIPRESLEAVEVGGYEIPAITKVIVNAWAIARDFRYWTEPEKFNPDRFLDNDSANDRRLNFEFIPFGAGRRNCPGMFFAMALVKLVLANLIYRFDWKLPVGTTPESLDMDEHFGLGVRRKHNLCLIPVEYTTRR
ncbi:unnamed protein product [Linum trigynum]|uniref:Cytochrome P450 n=1 Tax=Linum trigynum TaxID=586398 RepID=A0AAV2EJN4_9ROSI